jgi:hypothetical protein
MYHPSMPPAVLADLGPKTVQYLPRRGFVGKDSSRAGQASAAIAAAAGGFSSQGAAEDPRKFILCRQRIHPITPVFGRASLGSQGGQCPASTYLESLPRHQAMAAMTRKTPRT